MVQIGNDSVIKPIDLYGFPLYHNELNEDVDYVLAILNDDRIVEMIAADRLSIGDVVAGRNVSIVWYWQNERSGYPGIYNIVYDMHKVIKQVRDERKALKKPYKRWYKNLEFLGQSLLDDELLVMEIKQVGLLQWLRTYDFF